MLVRVLEVDVGLSMRGMRPAMIMREGKKNGDTGYLQCGLLSWSLL